MNLKDRKKYLPIGVDEENQRRPAKTIGQSEPDVQPLGQGKKIIMLIVFISFFFFAVMIYSMNDENASKTPFNHSPQKSPKAQEADLKTKNQGDDEPQNGKEKTKPNDDGNPLKSKPDKEVKNDEEEDKVINPKNDSKSEESKNDKNNQNSKEKDSKTEGEKQQTHDNENETNKEEKENESKEVKGKEDDNGSKEKDEKVQENNTKKEKENEEENVSKEKKDKGEDNVPKEKEEQVEQKEVKEGKINSKEEKGDNKDTPSEKDPKEDDKKTENSEEKKVKEDELYVCAETMVYASIGCAEKCQFGYLEDKSDRVCKPKNEFRKQIQVLTSSPIEGKGMRLNEDLFYSIIKPKGNQENNENGYFFFGGASNRGFNYLNDEFGDGFLPDIIENIDGMIISFSSTDGYYVRNQEYIISVITATIQENQNVKNWYVCGIFEEGGYSALRYFSIFMRQMAGVIVKDPEFDLPKEYKSNGVNVKSSNIFENFNSNSKIIKDKQIFIISEGQDKTFNPNYETIRQVYKAQVVYYENFGFTQKQKVQNQFFKTIEQMISSKKKENAGTSGFIPK